MTPAVRIEREGPVATVILERPGVRNAVDPPTAAALAGAFGELDADGTVNVIVLWGAAGTFCAGADLGAVAAGWDPSRLQPPSGAADDPFGPMGPTRMELGKPVIAAVAGTRGRRRTRTRAVVRPSSRRAGRRVRSLLPALGRAADRRGHGTAAQADRREPRAGPDPDRPRGARGRGACDRPGEPSGAARRVSPSRGSTGAATLRRCRSCACGPTAARRAGSGAWPPARRSAGSSPGDSRC